MRTEVLGIADRTSIIARDIALRLDFNRMVLYASNDNAQAVERGLAVLLYHAVHPIYHSPDLYSVLKSMWAFAPDCQDRCISVTTIEEHNIECGP